MHKLDSCNQISLDSDLIFKENSEKDYTIYYACMMRHKYET